MSNGSSTVSSVLAGRMGAGRRDGLPQDVRTAASQFLLNALGTIVAGSGRPVVDRVVAAGYRVGATSRYRIPARAEGLDAQWCALGMGAAGHVDDFDDTHPVTYIHAGPTLTATCLTLGQYLDVPGRQFLEAVALGYEVQLRAALAISPEQYLAGWHSTGVFGVLGATAAACVMLDLDEPTTVSAFGLAANLVLGHQEGLGTMNKAFHAGKAAANGIFAALAARSGETLFPTVDPLEDLLSTMPVGYEPRLDVVDGAESWQLLDNRVKPFPCGVVAHPGVEAAIRASAHVLNSPSAISRVVVHCSPLAAALTGVAEPTTELNAKLSLPHAVAAALVTGAAGLAQFSYGSITDPDISSLRARVELVVEPQRSEFSAAIHVERVGNTSIDHEVLSVVGSPDNPMSETALGQKFRDLVEPVLPGAAASLHQVVDELGSASSLRELYRLLSPVPDRAAR